MQLLDRLFRHGEAASPHMPPIGELVHWTSALSVGNGLIDNEHHELINVLNTLYAHHCDPQRPLDIVRLFERLERDLKVHFANEEAVMARHHCPTLDAHRAAHADMLAATARTAAVIRRNREKGAEDLTQLLRYILLHHILEADMEARDYMRE